LSKHNRPKHFDYNLIVIGGGAAGLVSAYIATAVKAKVALIEKHKMGGDCLNTGCVPSKALIRSARFLADLSKAQSLGFKEAKASFDFADVMERIQRVVQQIEPHDSVERYSELGVECISGIATLRTPYEVEVDGRRLTTRAIIIATGARPAVPSLPGIEQSGYLTSDTIWSLRQQPKRLLVLGGGPIGCELAQSFQRLGSLVSVVQRGERILPREDSEIAALVSNRLLHEGVELHTDHRALRFEQNEGEKQVICEHQGKEVAIPYDALLIALGRRPNVTGFGLEELGIEIASRGTIQSDPFLRTNYPNIYVCGDVAGPYQFTHTAAHQAWYAAVNALFAPFKKFRVDYSVIPWATYTDPEVARVGLNEQQAQEQNIPYEVTTYGIDDLDRAITEGEAHGLVKVLTVPGKDKILGATIVASHAGELITEFVSAMKFGLGLNKILGTIHIYPTMSEANKYVAGQWKQQHKPDWLLGWLERFHRWRRG
jgi:pyruvate/2-oxoglutarate dehydrogenase complex dihydrolipoamide dehydrogenase (E3) component